MIFDEKLALKNYLERKDENMGKQRDNGSLPAGSPMFYYCRYCGVHTETLPELHTRTPNTRCTACRVLEEHGSVPLSKDKEARLRVEFFGPKPEPDESLDASWAALKGES